MEKIHLILCSMMKPLSINTINISSAIRHLLYKKVNISYQDALKSTLKSKFIVPNYNELLKIRVPFIKKIKTLLIAMSLFLLYFTKIFKIALKRNTIEKNKTVFIYSLTKDQIFKDNSLHEIQKFLTSEKFDIDEKNEILIECRRTWRTKKYSNLIVTLDIPLRIFSVSFSVKQQTQLLIIFLRKLMVLIKSFNNSQYIYLVFKEYIFDENVYLVIENKNQIDKLITGPGNHKYQPIIFEMSQFKGERVMLWYSSNSIPEQYKSKNSTNVSKRPEIYYKYSTINTHWVWTNLHKKYLMKMTNSNILVKGSMIFYNPPKNTNHNKQYDIVVFDVTPQNENSVFKNTIYTYPIAKQFIEDIIESVSLVSQKLDRDITIYLKHKRAFSKTHSTEYITYIEELTKNSQLFKMPFDTNLYNLIASSKIIIGFPFTSPVIIGKELKVPSIHYSSSNILVKYNKASFIQDKSKLKMFIENNLGK